MDKAIDAVLLLQEADGVTDKKRIISDNKDNQRFRELLYYALNPLLTYKISENTLTKPMPAYANIDDSFDDIFDVFEKLSSKKALDDTTVYQVKAFLSSCPEKERELFTQILCKTLRLGVTATTVNKVIPNLIPDWQVQQAYPIEKFPIKDGTWFSLTQKLNGVRATYYDGHLYARSGDVYNGLEHITNELVIFGGGAYVFDGELTLLDKGDMSDNEAFRTATGIINSDLPDKTSICYTIFDVLPAEEFKNGESSNTYKERRGFLDAISKTVLQRSEYVSILPVLYQGNDQSQIQILLDKMVREDKEGLMVNLDVPYKRKRHNGILKVKRFYTMDLPIVGCEEGTGRLSGTLGAFVLDFNGNKVNVGSGFSDEQRQDFWNRRGNIVGTLCEVKYKEVSYDKKTGLSSLQFPVFVTLRTDKHDVSFY